MPTACRMSMRGVTDSGAVLGSPVPEPWADAARLTARVLAVNHHRPAQIAPRALAGMR